MKIIVSLTSYPARIETVHLVVGSLINQTQKADKIILWLAKDQFPDSQKLPKNLLDYTSRGLTLGWCPHDIKSYKKLVPALKEYPEDIIITVDDDIIYDPHLIKVLVSAHQSYPNHIIANRITRLYDKKNKLYVLARDLYYKKYGGFDYYDDLKKASCYNKLTGCGGVLYPPRCLHGDVFLEEVFMKLAPTSDDIWFWLMGVRNKTKVCVPPGHLAKLHEINGTQDQGLSAINDHGEKLFFVHLNSMLTYYPDILPIMNSDRKENEALIRSLKGNLPRRLRGLAKKVSPGNLLKHLKRYRG